MVLQVTLLPGNCTAIRRNFPSYPEAACGMLRQHCENFDNTRWQHLSQCNFLWNLFSELYSEMTVASGNTCLSYILRLCALGHATVKTKLPGLRRLRNTFGNS